MPTNLEAYFYLGHITKYIEKDTGYCTVNACFSDEDGGWVYIRREAKNRLMPDHLRFLDKHNFKCKIGDKIIQKEISNVPEQLSFQF